MKQMGKRINKQVNQQVSLNKANIKSSKYHAISKKNNIHGPFGAVVVCKSHMQQGNIL